MTTAQDKLKAQIAALSDQMLVESAKIAERSLETASDEDRPAYRRMIVVMNCEADRRWSAEYDDDPTAYTAECDRMDALLDSDMCYVEASFRASR